MDHISLPKAAQEARVSETTMRRWIQRQGLPAHKDPDGNWQVTPSDLAAYLSKREDQRLAKATPVPGVLASNLANVSETTRILERTLEREQKINDELRAEIRELRAENKALQEEFKRVMLGHLTEPGPTQALEEPKTEFGRKCFDLFKSGKTDQEISQILGKPVSNVRMALQRYHHFSEHKEAS